MNVPRKMSPAEVVAAMTEQVKAYTEAPFVDCREAVNAGALLYHIVCGFCGEDQHSKCAVVWYVPSVIIFVSDSVGYRAEAKVGSCCCGCTPSVSP